MTPHSFAIIAVAAACMYFWRVLPFLAFSRSDMPLWLRRLNKVFPPAIMAVLIVYCLKSLPSDPILGAYQVVSVLITAAAYTLSKNTFVGIIAGTAAYMIMIRCF